MEGEWPPELSLAKRIALGEPSTSRLYVHSVYDETSEPPFHAKEHKNPPSRVRTPFQPRVLLQGVRPLRTRFLEVLAHREKGNITITCHTVKADRPRATTTTTCDFNGLKIFLL
ncbi:hypothetical protein EVAR_56673_1 [Eumeta japonica]|uniref:Uncharacterized protein n=1 Tax=Eumeta variegata TaxID=151549 RepID=A0A4C1YZK6_EUMVA|nr:hypothetical protein EVAR_56673_1 [Eumeta japonica]